MNKIKEIAEFAKMFKLNIPVEEHFEYYINTLARSFEFRDVVSLVNNYSKFEDWLDKNDFHNVGHYKMGTIYNSIKNLLTSSEAYQKCQEFDYSKEKLYSKDQLKMYEGNFMLSLDFSSANFQSMKIFDEKNEMKSSWTELCESLNVHPMIAASKSFRQVVFGNLNPKRFQNIQHFHMLKLVGELEMVFPPENIIFISHDEVVFNLGVEEKIASEMVGFILSAVETIKVKRIENSQAWMNVVPIIFKMERISKGIYVKTIYMLLDNSIVETYKTLFGCPGSKYYINFKKYILNEEVEDRDCFFSVEHSLAKWVV